MTTARDWVLGVARWGTAILVLQGTWMVGGQMLGRVWLWLFLLLGWAPLAVAWRIRLAPGLAASAGIVLGVSAADLAVAAWFPDRPGPLALLVGRGVILALASLGAVRGLMDRRAAGAALALRIAGLALVGAIGVSSAVVVLSGTRDQAARAEVGLVLGFALTDEGAPRPQLVARVDRAASLYRAGTIRRLILSGGTARGGRSEAQVMRGLALARRVPREAILLEERSRTTEENFACSAPMLAALHAPSALLVTEPWHMPRAMLKSRRYGLELRQAPASSPVWRSPRQASYWVFREAIALLVEWASTPFASPERCP